MGLVVVFALLLLLTLFIMLGLFYRSSMILFFVLFTYIELLDKSYYLNHYYFVSVFSFILIFLPLNGAVSGDVWWGRTPRLTMVPAWCVWVVRLQLGFVYFFAGVAKLDADWLFAAVPLRIWLRARTATPLIGFLFDQSWVAYLMSWAGMLFDLTIFFWLIWPRFRRWGYAAVVGFHLMTGLLFQIGMFPYVMIACTLVFFDWPGIVNSRLGEGSDAGAQPYDLSGRPNRRWVHLLLTGLLLAQLLLPMRHLLYPGDVNWTEEGFRFAWRVMLVEKTGSVTFFVRDPQDGETWVVVPRDYLTAAQEKQLSFQPDMILQFAHFIEDEIGRDVVVSAEAYVSLNGRRGQLLIDPDVDLTEVPYSLWPRDWIRRPLVE